MKNLTPEIFTASLVNVKNAKKNFVNNAYLPNLNSATAVEGGSTANINMKAIHTLDLQTVEGLEAFNQNNLETLTTLQLAKNHSNEQDLHNIIK